MLNHLPCLPVGFVCLFPAMTSVQVDPPIRVSRAISICLGACPRDITNLYTRKREKGDYGEDVYLANAPDVNLGSPCSTRGKCTGVQRCCRAPSNRKVDVKGQRAISCLLSSASICAVNPACVSALPPFSSCSQVRSYVGPEKGVVPSALEVLLSRCPFV